MTSLVAPSFRQNGARRTARARGIVNNDFSRGVAGGYNLAWAEGTGVGDSNYYAVSAGQLDPFGYALGHGVPIPNIREGQNYRIEAVVRAADGVGFGDAGPSGHWPQWLVDRMPTQEWMRFVGVHRELEEASIQTDRYYGAIFTPGIEIGRISIEEITTEQRAAYSESVIADFGHGDVGNDIVPVATRLAYAPNTLSKLIGGGTLRIAMVGDSLMADTAGGSFPELLMRQYPGLTVEARLYALGSTGVSNGQGGGWLAVDKSAIYAYAPHLVYQGGISDLYTQAQDWADIIAQYRANISGVEIMVGDPVRDTTAGKTAFIEQVAAANECVFARVGPIYNAWFAQSGITLDYADLIANINRDGIHHNWRGWEIDSRALARIFGATF